MKNILGSKRAVNTVAIVLAAVIVIATVGGGAYLIFSNDKGSPEDPYADPLVQGKFGIGTTYQYNIEESDYPALNIGKIISLEIVGESGSYYLLEMTIDGQTSDYYYMMTHKITGQLRFGTGLGNDTDEYDGKTLTLWKNDFMKNYSTSDMTKRTSISFMKISSNDESVMPYKIWIGMKNSALNVSALAVLDADASHIVDPTEEFSKSDKIGNMLLYDLRTTYKNGSVFKGSIEIVCIADTADGHGYLTLTKQSGVYNGVRMEGISYQYAYGPGMDLGGLQLSGMTLTGSEIISTIDGYVDCDVYEQTDDVFGLKEKSYIGRSNHVLYRTETSISSDVFSNHVSITMNLKKYVLSSV